MGKLFHNFAVVNSVITIYSILSGGFGLPFFVSPGGFRPQLHAFPGTGSEKTKI